MGDNIILLALATIMLGCTSSCPSCPEPIINTTYVYNMTNVTEVIWVNNVTVINETIINCSATDYNYTKYSFTCNEVANGFGWLTKYSCYWATREKYGFGQYYDVATGCIQLGLPEVCSCYWSISEFTGTRVSTGFGIVSIDYVRLAEETMR